MTLMTALEKFQVGNIKSLGELFRLIRNTPEEFPVVLPSKQPLTEEQLGALRTLPSIYGKVVPVERRDIQPVEVEELYRERKAIDAIQTALEKRKSDIRTTVLNAMDVAFEEEVMAEILAEFEANPEAFEDNTPLEERRRRLDEVSRDKDGHYVRPVRREIPDSDQCFSWEVSEGSPTITAEGLKDLSEDAEVPLFTHEDYLAMTTQTRVFDEGKFIEHLKVRPELLSVLPRVTIPGRIMGSLFLRKKK